jgi:hypothetical protein
MELKEMEKLSFYKNGGFGREFEKIMDRKNAYRITKIFFKKIFLFKLSKFSF